MSLVKAETSKTHLEQRVEELSRQLQGDAERLTVYERRSSAVNGANHVGAEGGSQERQLDAEVADLRWGTRCHPLHSALMLISSASLKVAELDLAAARSHVQQYKEISQASEEALASLNTTYDEYKSTTEAQLTTSWVIFTLRDSILNTTHLFLLGPTRIPSEGFEEC
jgi:nucleoprotein TPR